MKKLLQILPFLLLPVGFIFGQAAINFKNGYVVQNGGTKAKPIYLVIGNPSNAATVPGNGWIVSEGEFNIVRWYIDQNTGLYTIPFGYSNAYYLPETMEIGTAGIHSGGAAWFDFSTYHTPALNSASMPMDVGNMGPIIPANSQPTPIDDSYQVVDRFWMDSAASYNVKPSLINQGISFSYISKNGIPSEVNGLNVSNIESFFLAQRYNITIPNKGSWGDWLGQAGTFSANGPATIGNTYSGPVTNTNLYRSWTLSNSNSPLPIEISAFTVQCENNSAVVAWTSQSELNNDYYTIKKSSDNIHFETVGTIAGAGTSSLPKNYTLNDNSPLAGTSYYFLYQTDFDNATTLVKTIPFSGCGVGANQTTISAYNTSNAITIEINAISADNFDISLTNLLGQTIVNENHSVALGSNEILLNTTLSPGIYILSVKNQKNNFTKKLALGVK